jgi:glycosyltransferase involved in cell wall biosynthesis
VTTEGAEVSGGDVRWIEIAKQWSAAGNAVHVLTPQTGKALCDKMHLDAEFHISDSGVVGGSKDTLRNYAVRTVKSRYALPRSVLALKADLIYSATEHYYDALPAAFLKKKAVSRWAAIVHWVAPLERQGQLSRNLLFYVQQRLGLRLIRKYADSILAVSEPTRDRLLELGFPAAKLHAVGCGVNLHEILQLASAYGEGPKVYDGAFLKRFHPAKGIFDVINIWAEVTKARPEARLVLIGGGSQQTLAKMQELISKKKLQDNIQIAGTIYDFEEKITLLLQSKVFLLPSHEENWAIVIAEALACGLPVICYDLPELRPIWKDKVKWVRKGDIEGFAAATVETLERLDAVHDSPKDRIEFMQPYDWGSVSDQELAAIKPE